MMSVVVTVQSGAIINITFPPDPIPQASLDALQAVINDADAFLKPSSAGQTSGADSTARDSTLRS